MICFAEQYTAYGSVSYVLSHTVSLNKVSKHKHADCRDAIKSNVFGFGFLPKISSPKEPHNQHVPQKRVPPTAPAHINLSLSELLL